MKNYFALFLIALMAVSVVSAAGVVTAKKDDTQTGSEPIVVPYEAGKTYTFTPEQFNRRLTDGRSVSVSSDDKMPKIQQFVREGTVFSSIKMTAVGTATAFSQAYTGTYLKITDVTNPNAPCTISMQVKYKLAAKVKAENPRMFGAVGLNLGDYQLMLEMVRSDQVDNIKTGTDTYEHTDTLGNLFYQDYENPGSYLGSQLVTTECLGISEGPGEGQVTAEIEVVTIVIEF